MANQRGCGSKTGRRRRETAEGGVSAVIAIQERTIRSAWEQIKSRLKQLAEEPDSKFGAGIVTESKDGFLVEWKCGTPRSDCFADYILSLGATLSLRDLAIIGKIGTSLGRLPGHRENFKMRQTLRFELTEDCSSMQCEGKRLPASDFADRLWKSKQN
jgi:hypothetical protein